MPCSALYDGLLVTLSPSWSRLTVLPLSANIAPQAEVAELADAHG